MAIHSSTLAWKIPWTEEPDRLQSMGSQRVGHDWATSLSLSLNGLVVFPAFNFSLNLAIRSLWSEPQSAPGLVLADRIELLHLWLQGYSQSYFSIDHLVMSMCRVFSCVVGRCLLWPVCSLGTTLLAFALLHYVLQDQTCLLLQVSLDFLLLHSSPLGWKDIFFRCCF